MAKHKRVGSSTLLAGLGLAILCGLIVIRSGNARALNELAEIIVRLFSTFAKREYRLG